VKIMLRGINERDDNGGFIVYLNDRRLDPKPSLKVFNHSPDGFAWGYGGSGPAQLALAVLLNFTDEDTAVRNHQDFKRQIIAGLPREGFEKEIELDPWLKKEEVEA
jgi:hypothetical protein